MSVYGKIRSSFVAKLLVKIFRLEIIGGENEPESGSYIVCANHISNYDPIITALCIKAPVSYMAKAELFRIPVLRSIVKLFGAYPVERDKADVSSIKNTISLLQNGAVIGMFPQGRRAKGKIPHEGRFKNGFAMMALKANVGVLPITIITKNNKVRLFRKTRAVIGEFIPYEETGSENESKTGRNDKIKELNERVFAVIVENYDKYKF